jgi:PBSX family phage terminase large subunit
LKINSFSEKQLYSVKNSKSRLNIWEGAVRSGKTIASIIRWVLFVRLFPDGYKFIMVGKTLDALKRNVLIDMGEMFAKDFQYSIGSREGTLFGKTILLVGANDERSYTKIQGLTVAGAYCDEITLYPESFFKMLLSRLSVKDAKLFGTCNPDSPYHWFKKEFLDKSDLSISKFHFLLEDNNTLDAEYVNNLKKEYVKGTVYYERYIKGRWILAEGLIYDMFSNSHIISAEYSYKSCYIGIDFGTQNATVFLKAIKVDKKLVVIDEYYHSGRESDKQKSPSQYASDLNAFIGEDKAIKVFLDPSATFFKAELRHYNIRTTNANNSVLEGIRKVQKEIADGNLLVHKRCKRTIEELHTYSWDKDSKGVDTPKKENDHCMDALRYIIYSNNTGLRGF